MERALYRLLHAEQSRPVRLRGQTLTMTLLTAQELLEIRFAGNADDDEFTQALHAGAALAAKTLKQDGKTLFLNTEEVLQALSAEEINHIVETYHSWSAEIDPGFDCDEQTMEALKKV